MCAKKTPYPIILWAALKIPFSQQKKQFTPGNMSTEERESGTNTQYRQYDACVTRYDSVVILQAGLSTTPDLLGCDHFSFLLRTYFSKGSVRNHSHWVLWVLKRKCSCFPLISQIIYEGSFSLRSKLLRVHVSCSIPDN
jgi:hypothetical protein